MFVASGSALASIPSWQDVVCTPGSVWGVGWGSSCSSHSVHCGPYFLGESGIAEPARPGPPSDCWVPSWEYVVKKKGRDKYFVRYNQDCFTTASANELLVNIMCLIKKGRITFTFWFWKWTFLQVFPRSGSTRFQSHPFAGGSLSGPAAAGSSAQVASPTPSAGLQAGNAPLQEKERREGVRGE